MDFRTFKPILLIAMPELTDPNFAKTVVLLSHFDKQGAFGFVINRATKHTVGNTIVLPESSLNSHYAALPLWYGGPVAPDHVWIIYECAQFFRPDDVILTDGVAMAKDVELLTQREKNADLSRIRVFHGYSGWGAKQLEGEIAASAWLTSPITKELLFDIPPDKVWAAAIRGLGIDPDQLVGPKSVFLN